MVSRSQMYTIIGIFSAAVVALLTAPYRQLDVSVVTFSALMVAQYCLQKVDLPAWLRVRKTEVRSRVFRYAELAKARKRGTPGNWVLNERSVLYSATELRNLPRDELAKLEAKLRSAE
jgi:hypothetical protein